MMTRGKYAYPHVHYSYIQTSKEYYRQVKQLEVIKSRIMLVYGCSFWNYDQMLIFHNDPSPI